MNIRHLRIFQVVCEEENITHAATKLFISQPAVSNAIKELEAHVGIPLFDRLSRRLHLNESGKLFYKKTLELLDLYDNLITNSDFFEIEAPIRIGSCITIANDTLPDIIASFEAENPLTPINVIIDNAITIETLLNENKIDIALIEGVVSNDNFVRVPFSSYDLVVTCSPLHAFAKIDQITIDELLSARLLMREKGSAVRDSVDSAFLLHNQSITPEWTSVNSQALIQAVRKNLGISVFPRILVAPYLESRELVELSVIDFSLTYSNHIVYHPNKFYSRPFQSMIDAILSINNH